MSTGLKLLAQTQDDLAVIAAALQDGIIRVGDIHFDKPGASLTLIANRFCHELSPKPQEQGRRVKSGLGIHNVLSVKSRGINRADPDAFMVLLDMVFTPSKIPPGGQVLLRFAGGGDMELDCECLEVRLLDMAPARGTTHTPIHPEQ